MQKLSFIQSNMNQLLGLLPQLVKGLHKASAVWEENGRWNMDSIVKDQALPTEFIDNEEITERLLSFCTTKKQFIWLAEEDLPFKSKSASVLQLQLTQEAERSILVFFLERPNTYQKDLLLLHFNPDFNYFGLRKKAPLNTQEKSILAHVLWNSIMTFKQRQEADYQIYKEIIEHKKISESEAHSIRNELEKEKNARGESLIEYSNLLADKWKKELDINIRFTNRAYQKIKEQADSFKDLEISLEKSIRIAYNQSFNDGEDLVLDDFDITLTKAIQTPDKQEYKPLVGRLEATRHLLDKYELAAEKVKENGDRIIGKVIGQYCNPPISNAAITDALKNHKDRIIHLLEAYPDRWNIIRSEFRSVTNLIDQNKRELEKKAG